MQLFTFVIYICIMFTFVNSCVCDYHTCSLATVCTPTSIVPEFIDSARWLGITTVILLLPSISSFALFFNFGVFRSIKLTTVIHRSFARVSYVAPRSSLGPFTPRSFAPPSPTSPTSLSLSPVPPFAPPSPTSPTSLSPHRITSAAAIAPAVNQ